MNSPEERIEKLFAELERAGKRGWFTKPRRPLEPNLRAAHAAWESGAPHELILAALLVDLGSQRLAEIGFAESVHTPGDADLARIDSFRQVASDHPAPPLASYRAMAIDHLARRTIPPAS